MNLSTGLKINANRSINPFNGILEDLLKEDIERFSEMLEKALEPQKKYLTGTELDIYQGGKKLRPIMLLLSARLLQGEGMLSSKIIKAAVSLEMLHVATLIHDDIIDDALIRRGLDSVNAKRGTNTAILIGDMQFVQAIRCFVDAIDTESEMGLVKIVLDTAFQICAGELDEIHTDPNWNTSILKQRYFEVIERKTAIMFGLACETGLALAGARTGESRRIGFYGRRVGRAFQIMDDLFDFLQDEKDSGKVNGIDLEQKRLSLPIIYAMEELGEDHLVSKIIRSDKVTTPQELKEGIRAINSTMAYAKCYHDARHEAISAIDYLNPYPESKYKQALEDIAFYTVDRSF